MKSFENKNDDLMNPNFENIFSRFGGARKFAKVIGVDWEDLRMWVANGYIPNAWRPIVRKAIASDIIKKVHEDIKKEQEN